MLFIELKIGDKTFIEIMLIKKPNKIRSYEITSERNYLNRRSFIQSGCLIAGGILSQGIHSANLPDQPFDKLENIKKLNKVFRKKNKSTDILSFPLDKKIKISKNTYLGDIIISYNYLDKPRSQNLKSFKEKVTKIFIHGFLHLLGFDHKKNKDYSKMLKEENLLFKSVQSKIN